MTYKVALHPSVRINLKKLYMLDRSGYDYVKQRLRLLAYKPEMGVPLEGEFQGKWRIHKGPLCWSILLTASQIFLLFWFLSITQGHMTVSYTHLRAHETD